MRSKFANHSCSFPSAITSVSLLSGVWQFFSVDEFLFCQALYFNWRLLRFPMEIFRIKSLSLNIIKKKQKNKIKNFIYYNLIVSLNVHWWLVYETRQIQRSNESWADGHRWLDISGPTKRLNLTKRNQKQNDQLTLLVNPPIPPKKKKKNPKSLLPTRTTSCSYLLDLHTEFE